MTSDEVARGLSVAFSISNYRLSFRFAVGDAQYGIADVEGCYCGINAFEPGSWSSFSAEDAEYAARETQALWTAILASLPCGVVNPPALDTLAGTFLNSPELMYLARDVGFRIPMVVTLESGRVTAELLEKGAGKYADLGELWIIDKSLSRGNSSALEENENHFRVTEEVQGKRFHVTLLGERFFVCESDTRGSVAQVDPCQVPSSIRRKLRTLQRRLSLGLAEYEFHVQDDDLWLFSGVRRPPTFSVKAFGDALFEQVVDFAVRRGVSHGDTGLRR
ncbi:MAG: hypothetical protein ACE14S_01095 [Candidatus Bathyarchaeia archaeon]